jgi:hypothetical protein
MENDILKKKRGRKPKGSIKNITEQKETECHIINLPIKVSDLLETNNQNDYNQNDYNQNDHNLTEHNLTEQTDHNQTEYNQTDQTDQTDYNQFDSKYDSKYDSNLDYNLDYNFGEKVIKNNIKFFQIDNQKKIWDKKTNVACFWDCHQFDTIPIGIPERYINNKYYVSGCFCSINCALAYLIKENPIDIWEKMSLLKKMYYDITNNEENLFIPAFPRETLKLFGGSLGINQYRNKHLVLKHEYIVYQPFIESVENNIERKDKYNQYELNKYNFNTQKSIQTLGKLKRSKPLKKEKTNLEDLMDLKTTIKKKPDIFI